ncbi:uncharacterized protein LAESUDRAFT_764884 [Laetiporus sulphureus 93-53]|uniref:Uncharacterized protein n=1 Tax=Laetiporus sulphureus 93-53 TaxID=1314785 RepID=A0A165B3F7_9APHY|nr:uncharacterized protein LAESUDRAFT_764884 [Laetiporus sulphureus 93-53]KZT00150.1 hypothetical protein LAESUDRAFT_764884 [Laetiporus sulphureus 93-53]
MAAPGMAAPIIVNDDVENPEARRELVARLIFNAYCNTIYLFSFMILLMCCSYYLLLHLVISYMKAHSSPTPVTSVSPTPRTISSNDKYGK